MSSHSSVEQVADSDAAVVGSADGAVAQAYQRRPAHVTAIQWTGENLWYIQQFCLPQSPMTHGEHDLAVQTLDHLSMSQYPSLGRQLKMEFVKLHDWLVKSADGELEVVPAALFAQEYEPHGQVFTNGVSYANTAVEPDPRD